LEEYGAWLDTHRHRFTVYANLDVIGDHEGSLRNLEALEQMGLHPMPVFHGGSPWEALEHLCARYRYIGLGGIAMMDARKRLPWLIHAFRVGREHGTRFHGLGVTSLQTLYDLPFYSVDSSSWSAGFRFGRVAVWDPHGRRHVKVGVGTHEPYRHGRVLRHYGADPDTFADRDLYQRDLAVDLSAAAAWEFASFLHDRNRSALRSYLQDPDAPGTRLYLAETGPTTIARMARAVDAYSTTKQEVPAWHR
jgi:hypothetical protein